MIYTRSVRHCRIQFSLGRAFTMFKLRRLCPETNASWRPLPSACGISIKRRHRGGFVLKQRRHGGPPLEAEHRGGCIQTKQRHRGSPLVKAGRRLVPPIVGRHRGSLPLKGRPPLPTNPNGSVSPNGCIAPLKEDGSMGRGSCRRDPLLWGRGEEVDGSRHDKNMEEHDTCTSFYHVCTL